MELRDVVITILAIINIIAFLSAIWVSYDSWRKGKACEGLEG